MNKHDELTDVRLRALEERVARLEAAGSAVTATPAMVEPSGSLTGRTAAPDQTAHPMPIVSAAAGRAPSISAPSPSQQPPDAAAARPGPRPPTSPRMPAWPGRSWTASIAELEEKLTGRVLAVVGGIALVVGAIFFLSLAFSRGWIGPEGRVLIGVGSGGVALALGAWMLDHRQPTVGRVLVAVGLSVVSLALFAATRLYGLIPVELALLGSLVAAVAAAFLAVRNDAEIIAVLALIAVLGAPPILGASPSLVTVAYLGTVLVGFAVLSLQRSWRWLPSIAFALSAPQLASWIASGAEPVAALFAVVCFWILNAVIAGGEEFLRPSNRLRLGSATLLVASAAFLVGAGFAVLDGPEEWLRGPFLVAVALAHAILAGSFLLREGDRHPFGLLAAGTGIAALTMAAPVQAGGSAVPIAWAAEGAALAWLASRRAHPFAALAAAILGLMALAHVLAFEYPAGTTSPVPDAGPWPFLNGSALSLGFVLGAAGVSAWFLRARSTVAVIASLGVLAVGVAVPHEVRGPALIAAWVALGLGALALERFVIDRLPEPGVVVSGVLVDLRFATLAAAAGVGLIALGHALVLDLPIDQFGSIRPPAIPFSDERALTLGLLVVGAAGSGWIYLRRLTLELPALAGLVAAGMLLAYGSTFEVFADAAIVIAAGLVAAGFGLARLPGVVDDDAEFVTASSLGLVAVATLAALAVVATPSLLTVTAIPVAGHPPFISSATVACTAIVASLSVSVRLNRTRPFAPWLGVVAGA
ncbi:MAG TPA: DUF2339 domain-containing protein, partial [Candidatus Limnocylindrales bacterium]